MSDELRLSKLRISACVPNQFFVYRKLCGVASSSKKGSLLTFFSFGLLPILSGGIPLINLGITVARNQKVATNERSSKHQIAKMICPSFKCHRLCTSKLSVRPTCRRICSIARPLCVHSCHPEIHGASSAH